MKAPLILIVSKRMNTNKKSGRQEDRLIRIGGKARESLGLAGESSVELWPQGSDEDRINRSRELEIFHAYSDELKDLKSGMPQEEFCRVGFVTSKTFNYICRDSRKEKQDIWIADTVEDTVIGGDPEFLLVRDDGIIKYAGSISGFSDYELGSDGPWAEVRPKPTVKVDDFIKNIRTILRTHPNKGLIEDYQWLSGCYMEGDMEGDPSYGRRELGIGGHIHIGTPVKLAKEIQNNSDSREDGYGYRNLYKDAAYSCLKKILDEYIAIPMIKLDGLKNTVLRRKSYGGFHDIRTDHGRLEYRTLSGEWFTHPELARAVIGSVKAVSHAFFKILDAGNHNKKIIMTSTQQKSNSYEDFYFFDGSFSHWKNIEIMKDMGTTKNSNWMMKALNKGEIALNNTYFRDLEKMIRKLPTYREYSEYLDYFLKVVSLPNNKLKGRDKELKNTWVGKAKFII